MLIEYYFIGLIVGFLFYELTGISAGGVIAPAYFALFLFFPERIAVTIGIALLVWLILGQLSQHLIIYGRRRLMIAMVLGFTLKIIIEYAFGSAIDLNLEIHSIGYIIPGLIANEMSRQKVVPTLCAITIVTALVSLIIMVIR